MNYSKESSTENSEPNEEHRKSKKIKPWQIQKRYSVDQYSKEYIEETERLQGQSAKYRAMARMDRRKYDLKKLNHQ